MRPRSTTADLARFAAVRRLPVSLTLGGEPVASESTVVDAGPWTVCFATTLSDPRAPVELHSTYQGAPGAQTQATHLLCGPGGGEARSEAVEHEHDSLPVWHAHGRLLVDHLQIAVEHAARLGLALAVGELDDALAALEV